MLLISWYVQSSDGKKELFSVNLTSVSPDQMDLNLFNFRLFCYIACVALAVENEMQYSHSYITLS